MMFNLFIIAAVLVVVEGDTLVENFYIKLKDLRNQYNSEIEELKQIIENQMDVNNDQIILTTNLTDVIEQTSLRSVVNEQKRVLETTNQTMEDLREAMEEVKTDITGRTDSIQGIPITLLNHFSSVYF